MSKKAEKLTSKQLYNLLGELRRGLDRGTLERIAPLVWHINWQAEQLDALQRELNAASQPDMLEQADSRQRTIQRQLQARVEAHTAKRYPLKVRLKLLLEAGKAGGEEWLREMRYFRLSHERAIQLAQQAKQQNDNQSDEGLSH